MSQICKINVIRNTDDLLGVFSQVVIREQSAGYSLRASPILSGKSELRLEAGHEKKIFQIRPLLHPSRKLLSDYRENELLLFAHLPEPLATEFRAAGICHADLNGRVFISIPGFILDRDPKGNRYRNPSSEPGVFSAKTSRIVRALLSRREREWTQEELTTRTKVSRGLVSRILKALVEEGQVERIAEGRASARYRVAEFDSLLDAWKSKDDWSARTTVQQYSLLTNDAGEIAATVRDAIGESKAVFTQWFAAHLRHPYTTPPIISAYVAEGRSLQELKFVRPVQTGGNLWLITPEDEGVFLETQECEGFRLVSDVQIYLDLVQMGQRGPDAAEALRTWDGFAR
jgi:transcriptional regulator with XRE-family HTH domain